MNKQDVKKAIEELSKQPKKKFTQTYDLIFTYTNFDVKKTENQLDFYVPLPFKRGKEVRTCALVGPELIEDAKTNCTTAISVDDFEKYAKDPKAIKKLADDHEYFIAQATIMPKVASTFGRVLGPRNKMPNPKAGCVVPPNANLKPLHERLQKTLRISAKTSPMTQVFIGTQEMEEDSVIDNVMTVVDQVLHHLPNGRDQIKNIYLKLTMSKPIKLEY